MSRLKILQEKYIDTKKLSKGQLHTIIENDPTSKNIERINGASFGDLSKVKVGKYSNWIIDQFLKIKKSKNGGLGSNVHLFFEDLYKTKEDLIKFDRFKGRLPIEDRDINNHTIDTLYDKVKDFSLLETSIPKKERMSGYYHPGANVIHTDSKWVILEINKNNPLGKEAAVYYGGYNKETRWCTSAPGLNYYEDYIQDGPLFIFLNKEDENLGKLTNLPMERYQLHFQSDQFMDRHDRSVNFVKFLQERCDEYVRGLFKPFFYGSLIKSGGIMVTSDCDAIHEIKELYGLGDFFEMLDENLEVLIITNLDNKLKKEIIIDSTIERLSNLKQLHINKGLLSGSLPFDLRKLKSLRNMSFRSNPGLKTIGCDYHELENIEIMDFGDTKIPLIRELEEIMPMDGYYDFGIVDVLLRLKKITN